MGGTSGDAELMSEEAIGRAVEAARARVARFEHERSELDHALAATREEQRLLERLLVLRRGTQDSSFAGKDSSSEATDVGHLALRAVVEELMVAGRPIHISDLMRVLRDRKVPIPGSGTQANLITHLRRDKRFVRPSRGMYGLAEWGLESMAAPRRQRRRTKHLRAVAPSGGSTK